MVSFHFRKSYANVKKELIIWINSIILEKVFHSVNFLSILALSLFFVFSSLRELQLLYTRSFVSVIFLSPFPIY